MKSKIKYKDSATATLQMKTGCRDSFTFRNPVEVVCYDSEGNEKWREFNYNLFTDEGLDYILDVVFSDGSQDSTHYIGLTTASVIAGDTLATGLDEFTSYTGDRQAWTEGGVSSASIDNVGNEASFSITGAGTVVGAFLTNVATGTAGKLICGVDFSSSRTVANGDTLTVAYTISCADS